MAKKQRAAHDDLLMTIDSEDEQTQLPPDLDLELELEREKPKRPLKKSRKTAPTAAAAPPEQEDPDINPDFVFALESQDNGTQFAGWDFEVGQKNGQAATTKDVDLDGILRRKGGLVNLAASLSTGKGDDDNDKAESNDEPESNDEDCNSEDDQELAMDGFGMGAPQDALDADLSDTESRDQASDRENDLVADDLDANGIKSDTEMGDTAEDMAGFYADTEESGTSSSQLHATFQTLQLSRPLLKGLAQLGYTQPSPIQSASIPIALLGKDIVAGAVTGSGKTAAYMIPIIERLLYKPSKIAATRVIVLAPTRELAIQVADVGKKIGQFVNNLTFGLAVGGLNLRQQEQQLKLRPDIVIATPGRLIDHIRNSPSFSIDALEVLVIDEADRMLEEGFQVELTEILSLIPKHKRQTLLFSATMNTKIQDLIQLSLQKPVRIMIDPPKAAAVTLVQEFVRIRKREHLKPALLFQLLKETDPAQQNRTVVFVARKELAHRLRIILGLLGMKVAELHGSLSQEQRLCSVNDFKNLTVPVLICTDLAARGLDIPKIEMVINYDMPKTHDVYLHRVGRTARAGRDGRSISLVGEATQDRAIVKDAIRSLQESTTTKGKAVSRSVDWVKVEGLNRIVELKSEIIEEVLQEEQQAKEIIQAEMQLTKAENIMKHGQEIKSRPKRTWFESEADKKKHQTEVMHQLTKHGKKVNLKKRKALEVAKEVGGRSYKKTRLDRDANAARNPRARIGKAVPSGKAKSKSKKK